MAARIYLPGDQIRGTVYRVVRHIATGGMGSVFDVEDTTIGKRYVLKTLHPDLFGRNDLARRMEQEARVLARLQHPNIVEVVTAGETQDELHLPYYVMERLNGQNLRTVLEKKGALDRIHAYRIGIDLLDALAHAHDNGVIHRDVKPENIFLHRNLNGTTTTKLLDFGIMRLLDTASKTETMGRFVGTMRYASPEQVLGKHLTPATDVYSGALVIYEMLAGEGPYDDIRDLQEVGRAHIQRPPPPLSRFVQLPRDVEALVMSGLAKDPAARPKDAFAFASELRRMLRDAESAPKSETQVNPLTGSPSQISPGFGQMSTRQDDRPPAPAASVSPGSETAMDATLIAPLPGVPAPAGPSPYAPPPTAAQPRTMASAGMGPPTEADPSTLSRGASAQSEPPTLVQNTNNPGAAVQPFGPTLASAGMSPGMSPAAMSAGLSPAMQAMPIGPTLASNGAIPGVIGLQGQPGVVSQVAIPSAPPPSPATALMPAPAPRATSPSHPGYGSNPSGPVVAIAQTGPHGAPMSVGHTPPMTVQPATPLMHGAPARSPSMPPAPHPNAQAHGAAPVDRHADTRGYQPQLAQRAPSTDTQRVDEHGRTIAGGMDLVFPRGHGEIPQTSTGGVASETGPETVHTRRSAGPAILTGFAGALVALFFTGLGLSHAMPARATAQPATNDSIGTTTASMPSMPAGTTATSRATASAPATSTTSAAGVASAVPSPSAPGIAAPTSVATETPAPSSTIASSTTAAPKGTSHPASVPKSGPATKPGDKPAQKPAEKPGGASPGVDL